MNENNFDQLLRSTLHDSADHLSAPDYLKTRIENTVTNMNHNMEGNTMKKVLNPTWKKRFVVLAAVAAISITGAVAGGRVASITSHTWRDQAWKDFNETASMAEKYVPDVKYVKDFDNGFTFTEGNTNTQQTADASGNAINTFTGLFLTYQKDGATLNFDAEPVQDGVQYASEFDTVQTVGDIEVRYRAMKCIYLPPDGSIKPTAEEQAKADAGEINIGYGTETREDMVYYSVKWIENDISYSLSTYDAGDLTEADFFEMASEIINA